MKIAAAARYRSTLKRPSGSWNFLRFRLERLQAVSSRNMYSEHGFDALIGPEFEHVCQRLIVVSYCTPGSPQYQVPSAICRRRNLASCSGPAVLGSVTQWVFHFLPSTALCMSAASTPTGRFAFWNMIELYASPLKFESYSPLSISVRAFFSSFRFAWINSRTSGCQSLRLCIL